MKKKFRVIEKIISRTICFPFILIMAIGYWSNSDLSYWSSVKKLLE